jgi:hypothetical protein
MNLQERSGCELSNVFEKVLMAHQDVCHNIINFDVIFKKFRKRGQFVNHAIGPRALIGIAVQQFQTYFVKAH